MPGGSYRAGPGGRPKKTVDMLLSPATPEPSGLRDTRHRALPVVIELKRLPSTHDGEGIEQELVHARAERLHLRQRSVGPLEALPFHAYQVSTEVLSSEAYLAGRISEAASQAERSLARAREKGQRASESDALHLGAEIAARTGPLEAGAVEEQYRAAMALANELGMRPLSAHCHLGLGKLSRRAGKPEQAHEHLTTATSMYREMDVRFWLEQAEAAMASLA